MVSAQQTERSSRPGKVSEWLAQRIVQDIAAQRLGPGASLPAESEALLKYQVSRGSLREAWRLLEHHGVLTVRSGPGGGPIIREAGAEDLARTLTFYFHLFGVTLRDLVEARVLLDPLMVRIATEHKTPQVWEQLNLFLDAHQSRNGTGEGLADADKGAEDSDWTDDAISFHSVVIRGSGNPILDLFAGVLQVLYNERLYIYGYTDEERAALAHEHEHIARVVLSETDDGPERAEQLMREHMEAVISAVIRENPKLLDQVIDWR